jgi:hypothetical protein
VTRPRLLSAVATIALVAVVATASQGDNPRDERRAVDLDALLLAAPPSGLQGDPTMWTVERTLSDTKADATYQARQWTANGRAPQLTQVVYRYHSAADAQYHRGRDDPAENIARQFDQSPKVADSHLPLSASVATISCAAADRAGCKIWVYWARYGQYAASYDYTSIDTPVPLARFEAHVRAVDDHLASAFQGR